MNYFPLPTRIGHKALTFVSVSCLCALAFGSMAGLPGLMSTGSPDSHLVAFLGYLFDPLLLQMLAFFHCAIILSVWSLETNQQFHRPLKAVVVPILILALLFLLYYGVNDLLFKGAFNRPRPDIQTRNNIGIVSHLIGFTTKGGAPSGFAARGVLLLLVAALASIGIKHDYSGIMKGFVKPAIVISVQFILLTLVCLFRVLTGFHFWFDIFLGLSMGTFLLWTTILLVTAVIDRQSLHHAESVGTIVVSIILGFIIVGFFYSRDASSWSFFVLIVMSIVTFIQLRANIPEAKT
jgi:hypothetical protein